MNPAPRSPGELAGWWQRVGATLIDNLPVSVVGLLVARNPAVRLGVDLTLSFVYTTCFLGGPGGQTIGMRAVGTRAIDHRGADRIGYGRAAARVVVSWLLGATIVLGVADVLWPLGDRRNQTLHDKAVGSLVVTA